MIKAAVPVFDNCTFCTAADVLMIVFGNGRLVGFSVATGDDTVTTERTTVVALTVTLQPKPPGSAGSLVLPKEPVTADAVRIVNVFPTAGVNPLIRLTFNVPPIVAGPVAVMVSNWPAPVPPSFTVNTPVPLCV